jgi:hypothetical protein
MMFHPSMITAPGNSCRPEGMTTDWRGDARGGGASTDHAPSVWLAHRLIGECTAVVPARGAEQPALTVLRAAGRIDVGTQCLGGA